MPSAPRPDATLRRDRDRFDAFKAQLAQLDFVVRGCLVQRHRRCGKRNCACHTDPAARHGPYVHWTRKVAGRTVSIPLRSDEVPLFQEWLANSHRLEEIVTQMHDLGLRRVARLFRARTKA
jgi:hypothetical protein